MLRSAHYLRPSVETLESRRLLAGNVTANIVNGNLILKGDLDNNQVQLINTQPGILQVEGLLGTTVNGGASEDFAGFTGRVKARLKGGDDFLGVETAALPGAVLFYGGNGNDTMQIGNATIGKTAKFIGADGDDVLLVDGSAIGKNLVYQAGTGDDDYNLLDGFSVGGNTFLDLGPAANVQDGFVSNGLLFGNLTLLASGSGNTNHFIASSTIHGSTTLITGGGNDSTNIVDSLFLKSFTAETGAGNDVVGISVAGAATVFNGKFTLKTQADDDMVTLGGGGGQVTYRSAARLNGGGGTNMLNLVNVDQGPDFQALNFV